MPNSKLDDINKPKLGSDEWVAKYKDLENKYEELKPIGGKVSQEAYVTDQLRKEKMALEEVRQIIIEGKQALKDAMDSNDADLIKRVSESIEKTFNQISNNKLATDALQENKRKDAMRNAKSNGEPNWSVAEDLGDDLINLRNVAKGLRKKGKLTNAQQKLFDKVKAQTIESPKPKPNESGATIEIGKDKSEPQKDQKTDAAVPPQSKTKTTKDDEKKDDKDKDKDKDKGKYKELGGPDIVDSWWEFIKQMIKMHMGTLASLRATEGERKFKDAAKKYEKDLKTLEADVNSPKNKKIRDEYKSSKDAKVNADKNKKESEDKYQKGLDDILKPLPDEDKKEVQRYVDNIENAYEENIKNDKQVLKYLKENEELKSKIKNFIAEKEHLDNEFLKIKSTDIKKVTEAKALRDIKDKEISDVEDKIKKNEAKIKEQETNLKNIKILSKKDLKNIIGSDKMDKIINLQKELNENKAIANKANESFAKADAEAKKMVKNTNKLRGNLKQSLSELQSLSANSRLYRKGLEALNQAELNIDLSTGKFTGKYLASQRPEEKLNIKTEAEEHQDFVDSLNKEAKEFEELRKNGVVMDTKAKLEPKINKNQKQMQLQKKLHDEKQKVEEKNREQLQVEQQRKLAEEAKKRDLEQTSSASRNVNKPE